MSDIMSKLRDMEDEMLEPLKIRVMNAPVMATTMQVFDFYFAAALTGVVAHKSSDKHTDNELVDQAFDLATEAVKRRNKR
jgi:hypothetical protein